MGKEILFMITAIFALAMISTSSSDYPREIVFTSNIMKPGESANDNEKHSFKLLDDIHFRVILDKPLAETYKALNMKYAYYDDVLHFNYALGFSINGEQKDIWLFEMPVDDFINAERIDYTLSTSDEEQKRRFSYTVNHWVDLISNLGAGEYMVRVEFIPLNIYTLYRDMPVLAEGTIKLHISDADLGAFKNTKSTGLPMPTIINENIEQMVVRSSDGLYPNLEPLGAIITDVKGDWSCGVDDLGNILRRYIIASVLYKNILNGSCEVKSGVYYEEHRGHGTFGKLFYLKHANGYYEYPLSCKHLNMK